MRTETKAWIVGLVAVLDALLLGWFVWTGVHRYAQRPAEGPPLGVGEVRSRVSVRDTARTASPQAVATRLTGTARARLAVAGRGGADIRHRDTRTEEHKVPTALSGTPGEPGSAQPCADEDGSEGDGCDSVEVEVPITQAVYSDSTCRAWVSGYMARLDSIEVYATRETVTVVQRPRPRRWSLGVQAGWGMTAKGLQPYVGVGVSYGLWQW